MQYQHFCHQCVRFINYMMVKWIQYVLINGIYIKHPNGDLRFPQNNTDVLRAIRLLCNKLQINITPSHLYINQQGKCLIEDLPLLERINVECGIRAKSDLYVNVRNNSPIPPRLPHDTKVCIIYGIKFTDTVVESIRRKPATRN